MKPAISTARMKCLVLACGNPLRSDDAVGLELARYAREWIRDWEAVAVVISATQWTPELAAEIASAESVIFLDCCTDNAPGKVALRVVEPCERVQPSTHHLHAAELLALSRDLYDALPLRAFLLTIGAASLAMHEGISDTVADALPIAKEKLKEVLKICLAR
jgi:hydrogenase maturation protease